MKQPTPILLVLSFLAAACGDDAAPSSPDADVADVASDTIPAPDTTPADTSPPPVGKVVINEIACQADPSEWVELVNIGDAPVDITGFHIADRADKPGARVPAMVLAPGQHVVAQTEFGLSCESDGAFLVGQGRVLDSAPVRTGDPELASWGRIPDGTGPFVETAPTPQKANKSLDDERATLFRADGPMPVVDLYVDAAAEASLEADHHTYVPAIFTWSDERGTSAPQRIDLRIKGAITDRPWSAKPSLKLHFARHSEPGPRAFRGTKKLALHSMVYDPSTIREWISYEVMRGMGVPAPRVGWAQVRVNGVSKGLYGVIENYDEVFLRDYFSSTEALYEADGNLPSSLGGFSIDEGDSTAALDDLSDRVAAAMTGNVAATRALTTIDWRELTTLFGVEDLLQHTDGMKSGCHNFYMHVDTAGFWDFMAWSVDLALIPQYGSPGPIGSCMPLAQLCDADVQCRAWFERARDEAAQWVLRHDLRTPAVAAATRNQQYANPADEPWRGNEFWTDIDFDLAQHARNVVDLLEQRARSIRCAAAAEQGVVDADDPTCSGFAGGDGPGKPPGK